MAILTKNKFRAVIFAGTLLLSTAAASLRAADVVDKVNWPTFMARQDMIWTKIPQKWGEGVFMGNGLLGANVYTEGTKELHWRIGRTDVVHRGSRVEVGSLVLKTAGELQGVDLRLDLWNATLKGTIHTSAGEIAVRSYTHADQLVQVIELQPQAGEAGVTVAWLPGNPANPRDLYQKNPIAANDHHPEAKQTTEGNIHLSTQSFTGGPEHVTAWTEVPGKNNSKLVLLAVGFGKTGQGKPEAVGYIQKAMETGAEKLASTHEDWWHKYWPESFVSFPDARLESFYWMQMYKLASATRADRPAIDLMGPWFNATPWAKIWWNLNLQLTYWPVLTSNRTELGQSLVRLLNDNEANLAKNAGKFAEDSATIGRSASYDAVRAAGNEICDFPWIMHNYYLQYRYTMDDENLRTHLFPLLKRAINYYLHFTKTDANGKIHLTNGYSPEYPSQPDPNPDTNIDLSLLRWGCMTLLDICDRLKIDDPLIPTWKNTLANLTPYPTDDNGLKISAGVSFSQSHRHYSHLLMIYPLYIMNPEQPDNRELVIKSLTHWMGMPAALKGYSYTGAASISALMGKGDDAKGYLNKLMDTMILPNTLYTESGPCIETPLSAAASLHDMLLSSWGKKIRVFPAAPDSWPDIAFHDFRTEGAFLVSSVRKGGQTQFIKITSLAGEPCRLITDMPDPKGTGAAIKKVGEREYEIALKKGDSILLMPKGAQADLTIAPVTTQGKSNPYGLH